LRNPIMPHTTAPLLGTGEQRPRSGRGTWIPGAIAAAWILLLVAGMGLLWRYKLTPGPPIDAPEAWLDGTRLPAVAGVPTLVMFVHPCCPCTRASLSELRGLLPGFEGRLTACVVSFRPADPPPEWSESDVLGTLASVPGTRLVFDHDGREAARFGIRTSGHVLLYGARGELRFSGGISPSRGHVGENPGTRSLRAAIESVLAGERQAGIKRNPVFGCPISAASSRSQRPRMSHV
jgi:hypothetical protein